MLGEEICTAGPIHIHLHPLLTQQNINFSKTDQDIDL